MSLQNLLVVVGFVIEALHFYLLGHLVLDRAGPIVERCRGGTRAVFGVDQIHQPLRHLPPVGASLLADLVADAPQNHARMISIAPHHVADVTFTPFIKVLCIAVRHFGNPPHIEGFVDHQQPHAVGQVEQLWRRWIVTGPDRIHSGALHNLQLPLNRPPVDGRPQRSQIVVHTDALQLHRAPVQLKSLVLIERDGANANRSFIPVQHTLPIHHLADHRI